MQALGRWLLLWLWLCFPLSVGAVPQQELAGSLPEDDEAQADDDRTGEVDGGRAGTTRQAVGAVAPRERQIQARFEAALRQISSPNADTQRQAAVELEALAREEKQSELAPEALFEAGQLYEEHLGDPEAARRCYRALVHGYPQSRLLRRANQRLLQLDHALRSGAVALVTFQQILRSTGEASTERRARLLTLLGESPEFALADQALFLVAETSLRLGDAAGASQHFATLHQRYPRSLWSAQGHRAQAEADLRARHIAAARSHYEALQAFPEAPWPLIASDGLRACQSASRRLRLAGGAWLLLGLSAAFATARGRRRLWPPPFEVWYYAPLSLFLAGVALWAQGGALALPIFVLGLAGTAVAWLGAAAGQSWVSAAPAGARRSLFRLLLALGLRAFAVGAICYLVIYHFNLVEIVAETLRNGPDAE